MYLSQGLYQLVTFLLTDLPRRIHIFWLHSLVIDLILAEDLWCLSLL
jgi:hypothetical protein